MKWVKTSLLKPGDTLAQNIHLSIGTLYLPGNTVLNKRMIMRIDRIGLEGVFVLEPTDREQTSKNLKETHKVYHKVQEQIYNIYNRISTGERSILTDVNALVDEIIEKIMDDPNIIKTINSLKKQDSYTYRHMVNVSILCALMGKWLGYLPEQIRMLAVAGLLHDIGKVAIPLNILNKPGKLEEEEFIVIKKHPAMGYDICKRIPDVSDEIVCAVVAHHERENGSGYPFGLYEDRIPETAKIIAIADVYDAMTSDRSYKKKDTPYKALEILKEESYDKLNAGMVYIFIQKMSDYLVGDHVELSNGQTGQVAFIYSDQPGKPLVITENGWMDLSLEKTIFVAKILDGVTEMV